MQSSLAFPEFIGCEAGAKVRLEIETRAVQAPQGWQALPDGWAYSHRDGVRLEMQQGIHVIRRPGVCDEVVRLLVLGIGLATMLHRAGVPVLHGTTVRTGGRDVCVVGSSGVGKSTVTAALLARGALLVADDIAALDGIAVRPGFGRIKLWPDTAVFFGFDPTCHARVHPDHAKVGIVVPVAAGARDLDHIVVLERGELSVEPIGGSQALLLLLANHRLPEIVGSGARWLGACQRLVERVPITRVRLPGPLDKLHAVASMVEARLAG